MPNSHSSHLLGETCSWLSLVCSPVSCQAGKCHHLPATACSLWYWWHYVNNVVVVFFYFSSAFSTLHFCWVGSRSGCVSPLPLSPRLLTICQRGLNLYGRGPSCLMWLSVIPGHNRGWSCLHSCLLCTPQISSITVNHAICSSFLVMLQSLVY